MGNIYTNYLQNSVTETLNLVDNLLMWSYSQIQGERLVLENLYLKKLAEENINLYLQTAELKNINMNLDIPADLMANVDKNVINLVIRNLLSNAIKFTPMGGQVMITAKEKENAISLMISDNGQGIEPDIIPNIFTLDADKSQKGTSNETGTGLGLVLCNDLLQKVGGKISVISKLGVGSTFFVELPLAA
jgi:signal transduction histidine kinase